AKLMPAADRSSQIAILSSATADSLVYGLRSLNCDVQVVDLAGLHRLEASLCALVVVDGTSLDPVPTIRSVRGVPGLGETPILLCGASG
ncbi:hypothetical protein, partial [Stenotrophomonas maltophilia]|uniref:hypothetical protein n=1 Tax=Stenotrophomonas maltophilia TaxID=40324 RepID=UPI0013DC127C